MRYQDILWDIKSYQGIARDIKRHLPILRINIKTWYHVDISSGYWFARGEDVSWYDIMSRDMSLDMISSANRVRFRRYNIDMISCRYWFARWEDVSRCLLLWLDMTWYDLICLNISCYVCAYWFARGRNILILICKMGRWLLMSLAISCYDLISHNMSWYLMFEGYQ